MNRINSTTHELPNDCVAIEVSDNSIVVKFEQWHYRCSAEIKHDMPLLLAILRPFYADEIRKIEKAAFERGVEHQKKAVIDALGIPEPLTEKQIEEIARKATSSVLYHRGIK